MKINHKIIAKAMADDLEEVREEIRSPKLTKTKDKASIKIKIIIKFIKSSAPGLMKKETSGKTIAGGIIFAEKEDKKLEMKYSALLRGKENTYSRDRFSLAPAIDKLEGRIEKRGTKMIDIFISVAISFPKPLYPYSP